MVSENIVLDDVCSVSSLVKFKNSGIFTAAHVKNLITDKVVLTEILMVPELTRNLVLERWLDDKVCSILNKKPKKCTTSIGNSNTKPQN